MQHKKIMYITGSFPRLGDGIGDAAGKLYEAMPKDSSILLVTSNVPSIREYLTEKGYKNVLLVPNWKLSSINTLIKKIEREKITKVLIEYAGNGYRKDLAISFLPLRLRIHNLFTKNKIECHLRLHEYTMCRPARKIFTMPLVWFCHHLDTPSYVEYAHLRKRFGDKVFKSGIGSNISWRETKKPPITDQGKINLGFFGGIYPGKGIETLIGLWSRLEQQYPDKFRYYLLGGYPKDLTNAFDSYQTSVERFIEKAGLKDKLTVTGFLPEKEIEEKLDLIDIAVLPYEDGLTLRRGSFLAFLGRNTAIVTSQGDAEARQLFESAKGVRMCADQEEMLQEILKYSENNAYYEAGADNARFRLKFNWEDIAVSVLGCFCFTADK